MYSFMSRISGLQLII